ncbi:MAG TPA: hypothetical protein VF008_26820 [Niastella sp.]
MLKKMGVFTLIILFLHCGRHSKPIANQLINGNSYECILIDANTNNLKCGILKVAVAMKFQSKDENGDLVILIQCPEMLGESFFSKGKAYRIKLTSDSLYCKDCTVINKYEKLNLPTYSAIEIAKVN